MKESFRVLEISYFQALLRGTYLKTKLILEIFVKFKTLAREKKQDAVTAEDSGETATSCKGKATRPDGASLALHKSDSVLHIANNEKTLFEKFNILAKTLKYRHKCRMKLFYSVRELGFSWCFFCVTCWAQFMAISHGFAPGNVFVRCCFPT